MIDVIIEAIGYILSDLIENKRVPKLIRDLIILSVCGSIVFFIGRECLLNSTSLAWQIFCFIVVPFILFAAIFMIYKVHQKR